MSEIPTTNVGSGHLAGVDGEETTPSIKKKKKPLYAILRRDKNAR